MRIPADSYCDEITIKRSRFIACGRPFDDPAGVKRAISEVRDAHPGCSHVVWAFACGPTGDLIGMNDDREPKGTAGRPVLEVVRGSGITNLLVTVTRYFGGTKLGTGGLVKAYSEAAKLVVAGIPAREYIERRAFRLELPYESYDAASRVFTELDVIRVREDFLDRVVIEGKLPIGNAELFADRIRGVTAGEAEPELFD